MKRNKWNPRKVLIASAGVASVNYALAAGCSDNGKTFVSVANLMPCPPNECDVGGNGGFGGNYTVANLVAPPPGGNGGNGGFAGASVANLVAPPPGGTPNLPDASPPDAPDASPEDAGARDAAADGAA